MDINSLEQQVQKLHETGNSIRAIANHLSIDKSKIQRIIWKIKNDSSDTANDTTFDSECDTGDTCYIPITDTPANRGLDTLHDSVPMPIIHPNNQSNAFDTHQKRYSLDGIKLITRQVGILKEDINDFVLEMSWYNTGGVDLHLSAYQCYLRRVQRLIQSTSLLAEQLNVNYRSLLVTQVLESIMKNMEEDLSAGPCLYASEELEVYIPKRDTSTWLELLRVDFLQPSNK